MIGLGGLLIGQDMFGIDNPLDISGCVLWLRADMGITNIAGSVLQWADQSGTKDLNKNVIQLTGANQPIFNSSDPLFNNNPSLSFNGTSTRLVSAAWATALAQPFTGFAVAVSTDFSSSERIIVDNISGGSEVELFEQAVSKLDFYAGGTLADTTGFNFSNPFVQCSLVNGASSQIFINQKTGQTAGNAGSNGMIGTCIGSYGPSALDFWQGSIAEVIIFNRALAQTEISAINNHLGTRYNIPIGS